MTEQINALLVHTRDETSQTLERILRLLSIKVLQARNCQEASLLLKGQRTTDLVFTGANLPDGSWADVLAMAQKSKSYMPVIVVSRMVDVGLYLDALGRGAFDLVTPPFVASDLAHIIRSAIYKELVSVKQDMSSPQAV